MADASGSTATAPPASSGDADPADADPLQAAVARLIERLDTLASQPDAKLTCDDLIATIGAKSHAMVVLIFALLNLLPLPPGVNFMLGIGLVALAVLMILDRPVHLWRFVGHRRLPLKALIKLLGILQWLTHHVAGMSRPRLLLLTSPPAIRLIGLFHLVLGTALLVPIPFSNTIPSIAMALVSVGILNRDGLFVLLGLAAGVVGLTVFLIAAWFILAIFIAVEEEVLHPGA